MANLTLRLVKGSPLTNAEVDNNFDNLNTSKLELSGGTLTGALTLHADPTQALQAATKQYVDEVAEGLRAKPAARAATTTNLAAVYDNGTAGVGATLTADTDRVFTTLDGVTSWAITTPPMGVLVKNQTNPAHNGRYNLTALGEAGVSPWVLTRCGLCDEADEIPGAYTFVQFGTVNGGTGWVQTVADPDTFTVGTDAIIVAQFSGAGAFTAGTGLTLTGNQFAIADDQLLPTQTGNNGRFLTTNGTVTAWADVPPPNDGALTLTVAGTGLSGSASFSANQAGNSTFTVTSNATSANTVGAIVARDGSGNFTAGTITAALSGNATTATTLATGRTIAITGDLTYTSGSFNGSGNVTGTGTLANSGVTAGTYGGNNSIPSITVDAKGRVTAASTVTPSGTYAISISGNAATATSATSATTATTATNANNIAITADTASTGSFFVPYVSATTGNVALQGTRLTVQPSTGNFTAAGTITANSDERIKTDWASLPADFIERLAGVKSGTYTRLDTGARQAGSSAQDWQNLLPEVVTVGDDEQGTLSLGYGNAALVAAVELAKVVVELKAEVQSLKAQLKG
jgi:hypothetical protein